MPSSRARWPRPFALARRPSVGGRASGLAACLVALLFGCFPQQARAFAHVVSEGDTLASIAEKYYGRIQHEKILVAANGLEAEGGSPIVPGMRLEVPAVEHHVVKLGETWDALAHVFLGAATRSDVLAIANDTSPWLPPEEGARIIIPYNLTLIATGSENIVTIAYKFLGNATKAWILDRYNNLKGRALRRGDVILVPLSDLPLTEAGEIAARASCTRTQWQGCEGFRQAQRRVATELPALIADVRSARYADAVTRGTRFLSVATLTQPQLAVVHRQLLEAYVALDAIGLATASCDAWRRHDPKAKLDPVLLSPKVIGACQRGSTTSESGTSDGGKP